MRSLLALALILLSANQIFGHNCIHDSIEHNFVRHTVPTDDEPTKRTLAETPYTPFRVLANYDFLTGVTEAQASFLKNKLIPDVVAFFSKLLSVQRYNAAGTLTLPNGNCYDVTIPSAYVNPGVDADFVLFVYASLPAGGALAVGGACYIGNDARPIAGITNFNAATINADPSQYAYQLGIIQHEITHALGFTGGLFQYWKTAPKNTQTVNWRGTQGLIVNTTRVAKVAQKHFNCSNVTGVEIENEGGSGSKGSHWERRVLGNEVMTASANADSRYSAFTLALLEDSGWYKANYTMAAPLDFAKNRGCSFIFQTCIDTTTKKSRFPEFCANDGQQCASDGSYKGVCATQKTATTVYNYFGDNTNSYDSFGDECPTFFPYSNGVCADTTLTPAFYLPEKYGATSKCVNGTLLDNRYYNDGTVRSGCYTTNCSTVNGVKKVSFVIGTATYDCANAGAQIVNIPGYSGYLTCPDANLFCAEKSTEIINPNNA